MGQVISATTRFAPATRARERFLGQAHLLLRDAHNNAAVGDFDLALECAYQAALRTAGALSAGSTVLAKRKRLPSSAWERLKLVGGDSARWAETLSAYSRLRSRVASGVEWDLDPSAVRQFITQVEAFLAEVDGDHDYNEAA